MSLIQIDRLTKSFGADLLFAPFAAQISAGDRIALIGDNGVGKSTLLRILVGEEAHSGGAITRIGEPRVTYLSQTARLHGTGSLWEAMEAPFAELRRIESELRLLETQMTEHPDDEEALHRYDDLLHRFDRGEGYQIDAKIRAALHGVGFTPEEFGAPVDRLSGGEEARAALARTLLDQPDVLLLDEPTNHLDFGALDWLEDRLLSFSGALLLVSHDRHLLDRVANRTWEIAFTSVSTYSVGYGASRELRDAERAVHLARFEEQEETIEKYKDFIRRHKVGQKHRQAKDREKKLERIEETRIDRPKESKRIHLTVPMSEESGKRVLGLRDLAIGYDRPLFTAPDIDLYRGEKVAIIGPNGCGKTTLLRTLSGDHPSLRGSCSLGHRVRIATYSQKQEGLHDQRTVLEAVMARSALTIGEARGLLGRFLFSGPDVDKKTQALSGGERSRVALALLSLMDGNVLFLDEPTNHLDLASQEILEEALKAYPGTLLLVSHDRALLEAITTQVWWVGEERMTVHTHGYAEFRRRQTEAASPAAERRDAVPSVPRRDAAPAKSKSNKYAQAKRDARLAEIEKAIETLEARLGVVETELLRASEEGDGPRIAELGIEHRDLKAQAEEQYALWEESSADSD